MTEPVVLNAHLPAHLLTAIGGQFLLACLEILIAASFGAPLEASHLLQHNVAFGDRCKRIVATYLSIYHFNLVKYRERRTYLVV